MVAEQESGPSVLPHLVRAVHSSSSVAIEALSTLEALLRQGTNMRTFADIVGGHNCDFFSDLADIMTHSIFLLQQVCVCVCVCMYMCVCVCVCVRACMCVCV